MISKVLKFFCKMKYLWNTGSVWKKILILLSLVFFVFIGLSVFSPCYLIFTGNIGDGIMSLVGLFSIGWVGYLLYRGYLIVADGFYHPTANWFREKKAKRQKEIEKIEEDKKYIYIINCPACYGTGEAYIQDIFMENPKPNIESMLMTKRYYEHYKKTCQFFHRYMWIDIDDYENLTEGRLGLQTCRFCEGDGKALAWFETGAEEEMICAKCYGSGTIETKTKEEVGMDVKTTVCNTCNGKGKNILKKDLVHVKTKGGCLLWVKDFKFRSKDSTINEFSIELTDTNREFFSKKKPRITIRN